MLCTRHEMSCTFNPNLSWIHHHTEEKLFEFVLESRHATAAMNAGLRPLNLSDRPACNSASGGKFGIKNAIDELVRV